MSDTSDILKQIQDELRESLKPYVGKEVKPPTTEEMTKTLQDYYRRVTNDPTVTVTPTDNKDIFNVSFQIPMYRLGIDLKKEGDNASSKEY